MSKRFHYWQFLVDNSGVPISGADVTVRIAGKNIYGDLANIYISENGNTLAQNSIVSTTTNGYFEFWIASKTQDNVFGYDIDTKFCIQWDKGGATRGYIDYVDIVRQYVTSVDINSDDIRTDKTISNYLARRWNTHVDSTVETGSPHGLELVSAELFDVRTDTTPNKILSNSVAYFIDNHIKSVVENGASNTDLPDNIYYVDEIHGIQRPTLNTDTSKRKFFIEGDESQPIFLTQGILERLENISHGQVSSDSGVDYHTQYSPTSGIRAYTNTPFMVGDIIGTTLNDTLYSSEGVTNHLASIKWVSKQLFGCTMVGGGVIPPALDTIYINKNSGGTIIGNVVIDGDLIVTGGTNVVDLNESMTYMIMLTLNRVSDVAVSLYEIPTTYKSGLRMYRGVANTSGVVKVTITVAGGIITAATIVGGFAGLGYTVGNVIAIDNNPNTDPLFFVSSVDVNGTITGLSVIQSATGISLVDGSEHTTYVYNNGLLYNYEAYFDEYTKKFVGGYVLAQGQALSFIIDSPTAGVLDNTYYKDDLVPMPIMVKVLTASPFTYEVISYGFDYSAEEPPVITTLKQYDIGTGDIIVGETINCTISSVTQRTEYRVNPLAFLYTTYENSIPYYSDGLLRFDSVFVYKNGNVGINNSNPLHKFCTTGDSHFNGNVGIGIAPVVNQTLTVSGAAIVNDLKMLSNTISLKNVVNDMIRITASNLDIDNALHGRIDIYTSTGYVSIHSGIQSNSLICLFISNARKLYVDSGGLMPNSTNAIDIGSVGNTFRSIYSNDIIVANSVTATTFIGDGYYFSETGNDTGIYSDAENILKFKIGGVNRGYINNLGAVFSGYVESPYFNATSKRIFKENIAVVSYSALDIIDTVCVSSFNFKEDLSKSYKVGFIADDTHEILSGKDHDKMDMNNCIGMLLKAVQELREENRQLRTLIS